MIGSCAKQRVAALISFNNGDTEFVLVGENVCTNPQSKCPRVPGEAYLKCYSICGQLGHAEEVALRTAFALGYTPADIRAIDVYGHHTACDNCHRMLVAYGLRDRCTFHGHVEPAPLTRGSVSNIERAFNLNETSSHSKYAGDA